MLFPKMYHLTIYVEWFNFYSRSKSSGFFETPCICSLRGPLLTNLISDLLSESESLRNITFTGIREGFGLIDLNEYESYRLIYDMTNSCSSRTQKTEKVYILRKKLCIQKLNILICYSKLAIKI